MKRIKKSPKTLNKDLIGKKGYKKQSLLHKASRIPTLPSRTIAKTATLSSLALLKLRRDHGISR